MIACCHILYICIFVFFNFSCSSSVDSTAVVDGGEGAGVDAEDFSICSLCYVDYILSDQVQNDACLSVCKSAPDSIGVRFNSEGLLRDGESRSVLQVIVDEMDAVPTGGRIRFTMYRFDEVSQFKGGRTLSSVLWSAANRGVKVEALINGDHESSNLKYLDRTIDPLESDRLGFVEAMISIRVFQCKGGECANTSKSVLSEDASSTQHNKFFLFEYTRGKQVMKKVIQTSSNFSQPYAVGHHQDLVRIENKELFDTYAERFELLKRVSVAGIEKSFGETKGIKSDENMMFHVYFYPVNQQQNNPNIASKNYSQIDPVAQLLEKISLDDFVSCQVHVASLYWSNSVRVQNITSILLDLQGRGCKLNMIINGEESTAVTSLLNAENTTVLIHNDRAKVHSKYMIISMVAQEGQEAQQYVLTGSQNFTYASLAKHDETLLIIENAQAVYGDYLQDWNRIYCSNVGIDFDACDLP